MTAEERLQALQDSHVWEGGNYIHVDTSGRVRLSPEDMDLIADLVVERLKGENLQL